MMLYNCLGLMFWSCLRFWGFEFEIELRLMLLVVGLYYVVLYIC